MKALFSLLFIAGAGVAGYLSEPSLRQGLTGMGPAAPAAPVKPEGNPRAAELAMVDLFNYTPEQLPKEVVLRKDTAVTDTTSGLKLTIPAGSRVKLVRLDAGMLVISPGAAASEGKVAVEDTDIREQLVDNPPAEVDPAAPAGSMASAAPAGEKPAAPPQDMMAKNDAPEAPAAETPAADPAMTPEGNAAPNPALKPEGDAAAPPADPAASTAFAPMAADDIVKAMQESIRGEQIKEFKFDQVSEWTPGEPETVDGKQFNTGTVTYKSQSFLGVKNFQAKAYVNGGKVARWIGVKTGMDLK